MTLGKTTETFYQNFQQEPREYDNATQNNSTILRSFIDISD